MSSTDQAPKTLLEAVQYFADEDVALAFVANLRWPDGQQVCPRCGTVREHYFLKSRRVWKCRDCHKQFSIKVGTIFEDSPIPLSKWMPAMWMLVNCKNGISSYELARAIGVTQKSAWFMLHRIRLAMQSESFDKFDGEIEGRGPIGKAAVLGLLERHGEGSSRVRTSVVSNRRKTRLQSEVRKNVARGAAFYTDALKSYAGLDDSYVHGVIDHSEKYVEGNGHTNGLENFWSLLKRSTKGTYVSVEPFQLFRYLDEQSCRFNNRTGDAGHRFLMAAMEIVGKGLTYEDLIGGSLTAAEPC